MVNGDELEVRDHTHIKNYMMMETSETNYMEPLPSPPLKETPKKPNTDTQTQKNKNKKQKQHTSFFCGR